MAKKGDVLIECKECFNRFYINNKEKEITCPKCKMETFTINKCALCGVGISEKTFCDKCSDIIISKIEAGQIFLWLNTLIYNVMDVPGEFSDETWNEFYTDYVIEALAEKKIKVTQVNKNYKPPK
jgi:hypothetical protein